MLAKEEDTVKTLGKHCEGFYYGFKFEGLHCIHKMHLLR